MSGAFRGLAAPRPVTVITGPAGMPHAVVAQGRRRLVTAIRDDWLVQDRWWTDDPVDRHYFELVVEPGRRMVVFRDERRSVWLTHETVATAPMRPARRPPARAERAGRTGPRPAPAPDAPAPRADAGGGAAG